VIIRFSLSIHRGIKESLNNLIRSTNRIGRGYSFEALRAKVLLSEGPENARQMRPQFQRMISRDLEVKRHDMRLPDQPPQQFGTPRSTLPKILGDEENRANQS